MQEKALRCLSQAGLEGWKCYLEAKVIPVLDRRLKEEGADRGQFLFVKEAPRVMRLHRAARSWMAWKRLRHLRS